MKIILTAIGALLLMISASPVKAQPSALDISFGNNGIAITPIPIPDALLDTKFSLQQPDGKVIMAININGFLALVRLNADGSLDNSFGGDGKILYDDPNYSLQFIGGVVQANGKIVVVGKADDDMCILRFNPGGAPDNSFDGDGQAIISIDAATDCATAVAVQADGKLVVAGFSGESGHYLYSVLRLNVNGTLDAGFDGDGKKEFYISTTGYNYAHSVFVQASGKILIAGNSYDGIYRQASVARLNADGSLDASFDTDGKLMLHMQASSEDDIVSVVAYPTGKILLAGSSGSDDLNDFVVIRLNNNGALDPLFDGDGKAFIDAGGSNDILCGMTIQPDGKIILGGSSYISLRGFDFSAARLNLNGSLDNSFDTDGKQVIAVSNDVGATDFARGFLLLANGKIFICGSSNIVPMFTITSNQRSSAVQLNADGSLDNSFDTDGKLVFSNMGFDDVANAIALNANGQIILAGRSYATTSGTFGSAARFKTDGTLDNTFNTNGTKVIVSRGSYLVNDVISYPSGKMLMAGSGYSTGGDSAFSITRLNQNGTEDVSFGDEGTVLIDFAGSSVAVAQAIALQSNGKILVAGYSTRANGYKDFTIVRLLSSGALDVSFDGDGIKIISFIFSSFAYAMALQPDGKILIAGKAQNGNKVDVSDFAVARLNVDGSLDNSFDTDGKNTVNIGPNDICYELKLQTDGKIVLGGTTINGSTTDFSAARLTAIGMLDNTFGKQGTTRIAVSASDDVATGLAIQADGKIIMSGYSFNGTDKDASIVRLTTGGALDNTFDGDGKRIYVAPGTDEIIQGMVLQADGKIVLAGAQKPVIEKFGSSFFAVRLLGDPVAVAGNLKTSVTGMLNEAFISQNAPNPFNKTAVIHYTLPRQFTSAKIIITGRDGNVVGEKNISAQGDGILKIDATSFTAGIYQYALYVDGNCIAVKQMIVAK